MYVKNPFAEQAHVTPAEKRQIQRRHLIYYLRIWDKTENNMLGHLADVSTDGFMLVGETPIEVNKEYSLLMRLPSVSGDMNPLEFKASSCWSSNDVNKLFYDTGFQFTAISDETINRIRSLIAEYGMSR